MTNKNNEPNPLSNEDDPDKTNLSDASQSSDLGATDEYQHHKPQPSEHWKTSDSDAMARNRAKTPTPSANSQDDATTPLKVGRYLIKRLLGRGGFGEVYLGFDDQLQRDVAIKLTFGSKVGPKATKMFMAEARMLAELDHPNIVPVFDIGTTERGDIFIVSKLIDGMDLATRIEKDRPSRELALEIIGTIAEALHYAHSKGLIHRDIKPANILLDKNDRPYLADFGIALRETDQIASGVIAGTPAYMSPEQARGEGHLMTNQSDIFSLGLVLYELLAGRRPYRGKTNDELVRAAQVGEVRTPRVFDSTINKELERVCLKALSRRPSDRYLVAKDFAGEVRSLVLEHLGLDPTKKSTNASGVSASGVGSAGEITPAQRTPSDLPQYAGLDSGNSKDQVRIVPRGLRSFEPKDSEFFLELLPGPYDRTGLPESLCFWKERIESTEIDESFRVGLVYGPSGCGKSSLMKAGLLPRISPKIEKIYIEATPEDTHGRLLKELQRVVPEAAKGTLAETLNLIRRRKLVPSGGKLLLVIDQFEQWLHAQDDYAGQQLTDALRQCDGVTVQAILMVRDDFWLSVSRFLKELDIPILERENAALVDLFDLDHSKRVLGLFGQAYDKLPLDRSAWTDDNKAFLDSAVEGLSENRKVISVRLALFAEMMKSRAWNPQSIQDVGGVAGVGVTFLEETFGDKHAPIQIRHHQEAVRGLLASLLPTVGTNIKGHSRRLEELQKQVGYENKPKEFSELITLLDKNLRLITPSDESSQVGQEARSYQLTHDYLVPSLREWLTQKQRETKKGRAELKLAERAATWGANPENKQLPTLWEWLQIRRWTEKSRWAPSEKQLMQRAGSFHLRRTSAIMASMLMLALGIGWIWNRVEIQRKESLAASSTESLLTADYVNLKEILSKIGPQSQWIADDLESAASNPALPREKQMRGFLGLAQIGKPISQQEWTTVAEAMLELPPASFLIVRDLLSSHSESLRIPFANATQEEPPGDGTRRLLSAAALALFDPGNPNWQGDLWPAWVSQGIATANPSHVDTWIKAFRPVADRLVPALQKQFLSEGGSEISKRLLTNVLTDYAQTDAKVLANTLSEANADNFPSYLAALKQLGEKGIAELTEILDRKVEPDWQDRPIDPSWKDIDAQTKARIERAKGMLHERFAFVQGMPIGEFTKVAEVLRGGGYRPTRVRPWAWQLASSDAQDNPDKPTETLIASVFVRDGLDWRIDLDVSKSDLPTKDVPATKDGYMIEDVAALPNTNDESPRFIALWVVQEAASERRIVLDLIEEELESIHLELRSTLGASRISIRNSLDGERFYTIIYDRLQKDAYFQIRTDECQNLERPQLDIAMSAPRGFINTALAAKRLFESQVSAKKTDLIKDPDFVSRLVRSYYFLGDYANVFKLSEDAIGYYDATSNVPDAIPVYRILSFAKTQRVEDAWRALEDYRATPTARPSYYTFLQTQLAFFLDDKEQALRIFSEKSEEFWGNAEYLYDLVCAAALCADATTDTVQKKELIGIALDLLDRIVALGFEQQGDFLRDWDLVALHREQRFIQHVKDLMPPETFAAVWPEDPTFESKLIKGTGSTIGHNWIDLADVERSIAEGWRPQAISVDAYVGSYIPYLASNEPFATIVMHRPLRSFDDEEIIAKRKADAAVFKLELGSDDSFWERLKASKDPRVRTWIIHRIRDTGIGVDFLIKRLSTEKDPSIRQAIILAIPDSFSGRSDLESERFKKEIVQLYRDDVHPGVHAATELKLSRMGAGSTVKMIDDEFATGTPIGDRQWFLTKQNKHTIAILQFPGSVMIGSPIHEDYEIKKIGNMEIPTILNLSYSFGVSTKEVTRKQFLDFCLEQSVFKGASEFLLQDGQGDAPVFCDWYTATHYCNWLSDREGLPSSEWCYEPIDSNQYDRGVRVKPNHLMLSGYRLPSLVEWEYMARSDTITSRFYGNSNQLLAEYAWFCFNSKDPLRTNAVGLLLPNQFGFFDVLGNVHEWCTERFDFIPTNGFHLWYENIEEGYEIRNGGGNPVLKGEGTDSLPNQLRCARNRLDRGAGYQHFSTGFRISRTLSQ